MYIRYEFHCFCNILNLGDKGQLNNSKLTAWKFGRVMKKLKKVKLQMTFEMPF